MKSTNNPLGGSIQTSHPEVLLTNTMKSTNNPLGGSIQTSHPARYSYSVNCKTLVLLIINFIVLIILASLNCFFNSSMSSIYSDAGPKKAYDGNILTDIHSDVSSTALHWWRADFNTRIRIKSIRLVARKNCCPERFNDYQIFAVLNDAKTGTSEKILFASTLGIPIVSEEKTLNNFNQIADGLILESPIGENSGVLNFAEIYIYGEEVRHF